MELRSGKILTAVLPKTKQQNDSGFTTSQHYEEQANNTLEEIKTFFKSLFYYCCKNIGYKEWLDDIERTKGRKVLLDELLDWNDNELFWKQNFVQTWLRMQNEVPCPVMLEAFDVFLKYEYNMELENPGFITIAID